jgi:hypothetical protein
MLFTYNPTKKQITIDNDDHYFVGPVDPDIFPSMIRNKYEDIIAKSFTEYTDSSMKISHEFDESVYKIIFNFNSDLLVFNEVIKIPIERVQKDYKDYINERITRLEDKLSSLSTKLENVVLSVSKQQEETSEEEVSEEEEVIPPPSRAHALKSKLSKVTR